MVSYVKHNSLKAYLLAGLTISAGSVVITAEILLSESEGGAAGRVSNWGGVHVVTAGSI